MPLSRWRAVPFVIAVFVAGSMVTGKASARAGDKPSAAARRESSGGEARVMQSLERLPLSFEEDASSSESAKRFLSRGPGYALGISGAGANLIRNFKLPLGPRKITNIGLRWLGANPNAVLHGEEKQRGESNFLKTNDRSAWRQHVAQYGAVTIANLYPGVDLRFHGDQQQLEFDYLIAPGATASAIRIGSSAHIKRNENGQLEVSNGGDSMSLRSPIAYQEVGGTRKEIKAEYVLTKPDEVTIALGEYDPTHELVIDPVLSFAAHFGSSSNLTNVTDVAVDSTGDIYLTGFTCDVDYPVTPTALQTSGGSITGTPCDSGIVTKLDPTASELIFSTYLGSSGNVTAGARILPVAGGGALVAGLTTATDFPTTQGAYQAIARGGTCSYGPFLLNYGCTDAFVLQLSPDGSSLIFSTFLGGAAADIIAAMTVDGSGNIYVAGATNSPDFPVTTGTVQTAFGGGSCRGGLFACYDAFVAKLNSTGTQLLGSTLLGGSDNDAASGVALDGNGNIYVGGYSFSANFPTTAGSFQQTHSVGTNQPDAFVAKLSPDMKTLMYSTFIGGTGYDLGLALRVDSTGAAYITGSTGSIDFPTTTGSFQTTYQGPASPVCDLTIDTSLLTQPSCGDIFVSKLNPAGSGLVYSTYIGGTARDIAFNAALDSGNNLWLLANTDSTDFPYTPDAYYTSTGSNVALIELSADGKTVPFATPLVEGNAGQSLALGLKIDGSDDVYVAGQATIFSPTPGTFSSGTGPSIFLAEFVPGSARPGVSLSATQLTFGDPPANSLVPVNSASAPQSVTLTNTGTATLHMSLSLSTGSAAPVFSENDDCGTTLTAGSFCTINVIYEPDTASLGNGDSANIRILDDAPGAPHMINLNGSTRLVEATTFLPASLTFNGQAPGTPSVSQISSLNSSFTDTNSSAAFTTGPAVVSGPNASDFVVNTTQCPAGSSGCVLTVTFSPSLSATGTSSATVTVPTDAPNSPSVLNLTGNISTGPFAVLSATALTSTAVGTTLNGNLTIRNTGGSALTVTGVTPGGANQGDFALSNQFGCPNTPNLSFTLTSQAACLLNLAFTPGGAGIRTATFTLVDNESAPASITISGFAYPSNGAELSLFTTPNPVNGKILFPDTRVLGAGLVPAIVSLLNLGSAASGSNVHITSFSLSPQFTQTNSCPAPGVGIGAGCTFSVFFAPTAQGPQTGRLIINTDAPGSPTFTVTFAGNGVLLPAVSLAPSSINFGPQESGTTSAAQTATLTNSGSGTMNLSNIVLSGPFTVTTAPVSCATIAAGGTCTFTFKFLPAASGPASGTLTASTNAAGGALAIGLNGTGITGAVVKFQPTNLAFGNQAIGSVSAAQVVTVTNIGDTAIPIVGVRASENFSATTACPSSLSPGSSCAINVSFAPTNDVFLFPGGTTTGTAFLSTGTPGSPFSIPLVGSPIPSIGTAVNIAIASSLNPSAAGQSVTFTATVTPSSGGGIPSGTVTFFNNGNSLGSPVTLNAQGKATFTTSSLPAGPDSITVGYSGDSTFVPANSSGFLQTVTAVKAATTTSVVSSLNPSTFGQSVTFTAAVTSQTVGTITGTVDFFDGTTMIGFGDVSAGNATFSTSTLSKGTHSITAQYAGDSSFTGSTSSPALSQVVNAAALIGTSTTLLSSANPSVTGQSVTLTATVHPASGTSTPTGSVTILDGATQIGSGTLNASGIATAQAAFTTAATHSLTASYSGDSNFSSSVSSPALSQVVNKGSTSTALASSLNPSGTGQSVRFTATVAAMAPGAGTPTGSVDFFDGTTQIGSGTLSAGVATFATTALPVGTHSITAQYAGDSNFNGSTSSPTLTQTVNPNPPTFTLSALSGSSAQVVAGHSTNPFTFTVSPQNGSKQIVTFACSGLPVKATCMFQPASLTLDGQNSSAPVSVTITTTADTLAAPDRRFQSPWNWTSLQRFTAIALLAVSLALFATRRKKFGWAMTVTLLILMAASLPGCNSSSYSTTTTTYTGTPPGTSTITIMGTGAPGPTTANAPGVITLTVTAQ
jgi:Bacterial Ig-like domain (group 3)/Beta-propeller repeat